VVFVAISVKDACLNAFFLCHFCNCFTGFFCSSIIDAIPTLKYITTRSTGFDHIDVAYARSKNILVSNVPAYGSSTVAEFAFALLLNLSRKVYLANQELKENADFSIYSFRGFDLKDKVMGVIGTGKIGKNFIKMAKGFGMRVVAYECVKKEDIKI
jgi:D-lactate dehydrogenase